MDSQQPGGHERNQDPNYRETDRLTHIDGFLVTDGTRYRLTMSKRLTSEQRERGVQDLLKQKEHNTDAALYVWSRT